MWSARQVGIILAYAAVPLLLVVGSVALAVTEGAPAPQASPAASNNSTPTMVTPTVRPTQTAPPTSTMPASTSTVKPAASTTASPTPLAPTASPTTAALPTASSPAAASSAGTAVAPTSLPVAPQAESCGPFPGWTNTYVVRPGDTLFRIALRHRTSVWELRQANCKDSAAVVPGERLWIPAEKSSHWKHRPLPAFRWQWWRQFPWADSPRSAPGP